VQSGQKALQLKEKKSQQVIFWLTDAEHVRLRQYAETLTVTVRKQLDETVASLVPDVTANAAARIALKRFLSREKSKQKGKR
jgi:hypothetical protein